MVRFAVAVLVLGGVLLTAGHSPTMAAGNPGHSTGAPVKPTAPRTYQTPKVTATTTQYQLTAWAELGMHCIDGKDYSVFSILPPYNSIHAQLMTKASSPQLVTSGVTITYQAVKDTTGSINTISSTKTNFWTYAQPLFHASPAKDVGLTGNKVQSLTPNPMTYNASTGWWEAIGVPTVPYDNARAFNAYPTVSIVAKDLTGKQLASVTIVMAVSDEISCNNCHASNSGDNDAKPKKGWVNKTDPAKDTKYNILRKHDDRFDITPYLSALAAQGYTYKSTLESTALGGTPVLCAACHSTNALGTPGVAGVGALTADMHTLHGPQINYANGISLDNQTDPLTSCYLCHPGVKTQCNRGTMSATVKCQDCHGNLTTVGQPTRAGWLDVPACQMCHENSTRYTTTFDTNGQWRVATDTRFATQPNVPKAPYQLFRYSDGHGNVGCPACHGAPHAEFATTQANDQLYSSKLQGHTGKIAECTTCHNPVPFTNNGGPHQVHSTNSQSWVSSHGDYAEGNGKTACAYCHGSDYRGSFLAVTTAARTFNIDGGKKTYSSGTQVTCYDCHNGPNGG